MIEVIAIVFDPAGFTYILPAFVITPQPPVKVIT